MKELTPYLVRIAGLIMIVFAITKFPMFYFSYISQLDNSFMAYFMPLIIQLFIGIIFFALPRSIGNIVIEIKEPVSTEIETNKILYICIILTGLVFLFYSLSDTIFHVSNYLFLKNQIEDEMSILNYDYPSLIATLVELAFSLILVLKAKTIINIIKKVS